MIRHFAAAVLACLSLPLAAAERRIATAEPAAGSGGSSGFAWTLGAHVGVPLGLSVSGSAILGHADATSAHGLVLMAEPGIGGGKLAVGYADITGSRSGPYLMKNWRDWANSSSFLWAHRGWSARGALLHSWGGPLTIDRGRSYFGPEFEFIGTFAENSAWGGLHGMNATIGLLTNIDTVDHRNRFGRNDDIEPGDQWLLLLTAGVGF
jgi:hypothetical protein